MTSAVLATSRQSSAGGSGPGSGPDPQTKAEKSVHFINAEVLDPPVQGNISFVGPYLDQTLAMAAEDARSFVQGAEQILLVALAKALAMALGEGGALEAPSGATSPLPDDDQSGPEAPAGQPAPSSGTAQTTGLTAIQGMMASLTTFHASMAETAHRFRVDR